MKNSFFLTIPPQKDNPEALRGFDPVTLKNWIAEIPTANYGMTARVLHERIIEMNGIEADAVFRLEALELMRPCFLLIEEYLRARITGTGFPLTENQQKIGDLLVQLTRNFAASYWLVVRDLTRKAPGWFQNKTIALAIQRVMGGLNGVVLAHYLMALPVPNWVWMDLHALCRLARDKKKEGVKIKSGAAQGGYTSVEDTYKQIVLVSLADPYGLLQREVLDLYAFAGKLTHYVEIATKTAGSGVRCILSMDEDKPPMWLNPDAGGDGESTHYQVNLGKLVDYFKKHPERSVNAEAVRFGAISASAEGTGLLAPELAEYLMARWSGRPLQGDAVFQDRQDRLFTIGLKATHSHLTPAGASEAGSDELLVESASEKSLSCAFDQPGQIFVGSLVSFRRSDADYTQRALAVVCRISAEKGQARVKFEVHVLTPQVYAVGTQALSAKDPHLYQRTLLYVDKGQSNNTYIVLESQKLKEGDVIRLLMQNDALAIQLRRRRSIALGYWQFECVRVAEQKTVEIPKKGYDFV